MNIKNKNINININNKGITLIALVITIVILIILAGITINIIVTENKLINTANSVKEKQKIAEISEELELKKADIVLEEETLGITIDEYVNTVVSDQNMVHKVYRDGVEKLDEKNTYITVDDEYVFLLEQLESGNLKITYEGKASALKPRIQDVEIKTSTSTIEIKLTAIRAEKYIFYIKEKDAPNYSDGIEKNIGEYTFKNLAQNKEYSIKIEAINNIGKDEIELNRTTGQMSNLTQSEVKYIKTETNWTNKNVITTIELNTDKEVEEYKIQYTKFTEGEDVTSEKIKNANWLYYQDSGIVSEENEIIYTRLYDGYNATSYTSTEIKNIDKTNPIISTELTSSNVTTKGFTLNVRMTDTNSGFGKIVWYYKLSTESKYTSVEEVDTQLNGSIAGTKIEVTKTKILDNLTKGKYNTYVVVYDVAGNSIESEKVDVTLENMTTASGATASPTAWTNGKVTITLPAAPSGQTTQYQIGSVSGTWNTYNASSKPQVSGNTTVYYRFTDGKNAGNYASKTISNIDTLSPGATTVTFLGGANTCAFKNNYNIKLSANDANATTSSGKSDIVHYEVDWDNDGVSNQTIPSNFVPWDNYSSCSNRFRAVDNAGNKGAWTTTAYHIHMDTTVPKAPSVPDLIAGHDTGSSNTDNITKWYAQVKIQGTAEPGVKIDLRISNISDEIIGTGTADSNGKWVIPINLHQNVWNHIYAWSVDAAGNYTWQSGYLAVYSDTKAPGVPTITYNGGGNSCSWKNNYNLTLSCSDATGIWKYQTDHYQDGTVEREITSNFVPENGYSTCTDRYRAVDKAGNEGSWTAAQHIHMDTEKPKHTNWWWGEVTKDVARLYVQTTDNIAVAKVQYPTSTQSGGYNNWHWYTAVWDSSANAYRCDITPSTFGHYNQVYKTHLYIYDNAGNGGYYNETSVTIPAKEEKHYIVKDGVVQSMAGGSFVKGPVFNYYYSTKDIFEQNNSSLYFEHQNESTLGSYVTYRTNSLINFTGYKQLCIEWEAYVKMTADVGSGFHANAIVGIQREPGDTTKYITSISTGADQNLKEYTVTRRTETIDVTNINEQAYIVTYTGDCSGITKMRIYNMYLVK